MTLLITIFAAILSTIIWYMKPESAMKPGFLCLMYWGAALMWFVDALAEYWELGAAYFKPAPADMLNDTYLGFSAVAFGLLIWLAVLLVKDPAGRVRSALRSK